MKKTKSKKLKEQEKQDRRVGCAMSIIENIIEPLHFPKRGVSGERYYQLESEIIFYIKMYENK